MLNFKKFKKKYIVKVPKQIAVLHCDKKNIITFTGPFQKKSFKLRVKTFLISPLNLIVVSPISVNGESAINFKNVKKIQGTTVAKIKQILIEIIYPLHHKLNLVGVGYRIFSYEKSKNKIYLKLGYSHLIYFKTPNSMNIFCNPTKLFIFEANSFDAITQTAAQIKMCKDLDVYKGKGILSNEKKIILRKGEKI